jgi:hypothetical protein
MALLTVAPWKVLLILQILWFGGASAAGLLADKAQRIFNMSHDELPHPNLISAVFPIATILCMCGLFVIGLAKKVLQTRRAAKAKASAAEERKKLLEGKSDWSRKKEAAELCTVQVAHRWHKIRRLKSLVWVKTRCVGCWSAHLMRTIWRTPTETNCVASKTSDRSNGPFLKVI